MIQLFADQRGGLFLFELFDLLDDLAVARIVGIALEMIHVTRQSAPLFNRHLTVEERVSLANGGFCRCADIISRSDADQVHRAQQPVEDAAQLVDRALAGQLIGSCQIVLIDNRLQIFFTFRRRGILQRLALRREIALALFDSIVQEILGGLGQSGARSVLFLEPAVFGLKKFHMFFNRCFAVGKRIDQQFTRALVDFIGEKLRRHRRLFERIEFRQGIQNTFDDSLVLLPLRRV